jgi:hypothetical protein
MIGENVIIDHGLRGNINLKRINTEISWTQEMIEEYIKCSQDPIHFIKTYVRIVHVDRGLVPFELYDYQEQMVNSMAENRYTIITTARQVGKSTSTVAFILWYVLFNSDKTVALLANKAETAREIMSRVQLAFEHLPKWLQQGVIEWNKGSFKLENNSRVIASATSASAIRGYSINLLFIDEAAFIENWDEFFTSVFPTVTSGDSTKVILVSTPNGMNHFYKLWTNAIEDRNQYHPIKVMWYDVPGRDEKWKQDVLAGLNYDYEKFEQENCCEFIGSSGTLISGAKLKQLVHQTPITQSNGISSYKNPIKGHTYTIVADVSRGKGLDYSAFQVIDVTRMPYEQVCVFRDNMITPVDYSSIINRIAHFYNDAQVLVEVNDIGEQVAVSLYEDFEYENVLFTESSGRSGKRIATSLQKGVDRGIRTTKTVKSIGCSVLKLLVEQNQLIINDFATIEELSTFSKKGVSWEAESGCHDDLVMCLVLFAWLSNQKFFRELTDINTLNNLRDVSEDQLFDQLTPFGIIDDGRNDFVEEQIFAVGDDSNWLSLNNDDL